jgi:hypothetical protein
MPAAYTNDIDLPVIADGDESFIGVDTHMPAHKLQPGYVAEAVNKRFEDGEAWPRFGVGCQAWGQGQNRVVGAATYNLSHNYVIDGIVIGNTYLIKWGANEYGSAVNGPLTLNPTTTAFTSFVAQGTTLVMFSLIAGSAVTAQVYGTGNPCAFARFNDPGGFDSLVLVTDEFRTDDGRGRVWRLLAGSAPVEIPLNGHDVWGTSRLVPCNNGLVLLRQGNERVYFGSSAVGADIITLHAEPAFVTGDRVIFVSIDGGNFSGTAIPNPNAGYWVNVSGVIVKLYDSETNARLGGATGRLSWVSAAGRYYLERQTTNPGFFGNGAPPLLMQPGAVGETCFDVGFLSVDTSVEIQSANTQNVVTAPNHRFLPGDQVLATNITFTPAYVGLLAVYPLSDHTITFHATQDDALVGDNPLVIDTISPGASLARTGASGIPMPSGREGIYYKNRLVIANAENNVAISDPLDPLHFTPFETSFSANLGESDDITGFAPLNEDVVLIGKTNSVLAITGLSGTADTWRLLEITREYGWIAPLAVSLPGSDVWALSRKGVCSIKTTDQGKVQGVAEPVSRPMKRYLDSVDWSKATQSCSHYWNNRYFVALPGKGQSGTVKNNIVLVFNFLNGAWEGKWSGSNLEIYAFARHQAFGEETLCFVNYDGQVCFFTDGWTDPSGADFSDQLRTRTYTAGVPGRKTWLKADLVWDSQRPNLIATALSPGYNESQVILERTYDPLQYTVEGVAAYDPGTSTDATFEAPDREDYSTTPEELLVGTLDAHQNHTEQRRMRLTDWGVAIDITNTAGSARIQSVLVSGNAMPRSAERMT